MKIIIAIFVVVVVLAVLAFIIVRRRKPAVELTAGQSKIRGSLRETATIEDHKGTGSPAVNEADLVHTRLR